MTESSPIDGDQKNRDLLIKLQILTNGLVDERKKSASYLQKIKELEKTLQQKENELVDLNKEKFDLKSALAIEKSKKAIKKEESGGFFSRRRGNTVDLGKLSEYEELINQQKFEIKDLTSRLMDEKETFDQQKIKFQTLITLQNQQMKELNDKITKLNEENNQLLKKQENVNLMLVKFEVDKKSYEDKFNQYEQEKKNLEKQNTEQKVEIENLKNDNEKKDNEIKSNKKLLDELAVKLNSMKMELLDRQLSPKSFKVEKIKDGVMGSKKLMTVKFYKNSVKDTYEIMFIQGDEKESVNLLDLSKFSINDKTPNRVDVSYIVNEKAKTISFLVHELLIDYFFQTYRDFEKKANECE